MFSISLRRQSYTIMTLRIYKHQYSEKIIESAVESVELVLNLLFQYFEHFGLPRVRPIMTLNGRGGLRNEASRAVGIGNV